MANFPYIYCPVCATKLEESHVYGELRPRCPACDFVRFRDPKVSVIGVVTVEDRILMTRRAVAPQKGKWSLPGGYMDAGEMPVPALKRELMEEVGLEIEIGDLIEIFPLTVERADESTKTINDLSGKMPRINDTLLHDTPIYETIGIVLAFEAWPASGQMEPLESNDDVSDAAWMSWSELPLDDLAFESTSVLLEQWRSKK